MSYVPQQKTADLIYGLLREKPTALILEKAFDMKLKHSLFKYSLFDYYDTTNKYILEIKNYRYGYNEYATEIIGVNKGLCENSILIFRHEDTDNQIYFIQFNKELFKTFNTRPIWYRGTSVMCYDIKKEFITHLKTDQKYTFKNTEEEKAFELIEKDRQNYLTNKKG